MFADDTQLINKTEEYIEEAFKTLEIYEKASGAKKNLEKTVGMYLEIFPKYVRSLDFQTSNCISMKYPQSFNRFF
jgi:hypothetical protein